MPYKDPIKRREYKRAWDRKRPKKPRRYADKVPEQVLAATKFRAWRWNLKRHYGISAADYDRMFADQNGVCAICSKPAKEGKRLSIDHDHSAETNSCVRGLLCVRCNTLIANLEHELREKAEAYLALYKGRRS